MTKQRTINEYRQVKDAVYNPPSTKIRKRGPRRLILVRGVSGAGKTTFAEMITDWVGWENCYCLSADDFFEDEKGNYSWDLNKLAESHSWCQGYAKKVMGQVTGFRTLVVHNTFTTEKEMEPYIDMAKQFGWEVTTIIIENRHGGISVHDVPEEAIKRQTERFEIKLTSYE
jgi:predicted kinase